MSQSKADKRPWPMIMRLKELRWRQISILAITIFAILEVTFYFGGLKGGFYIGFAVASGGIAIGLLQAYIGSVVDDLLLFRKPFYHWSAATLMALGTANLLTALVDLKATDIPEQLTALAQALQVAGLALSIRLFGEFLFSEPHHHSEDVASVGQPKTPGFISFILAALPDTRIVLELAKSVDKEKKWLIKQDQNIGKNNGDDINTYTRYMGGIKRAIAKTDPAELQAWALGGVNFLAFSCAILSGIYLVFRAIFPQIFPAVLTSDQEKALPILLSVLAVAQVAVMTTFRVYMMVNFESVTRTFAAVVGFSLLALTPPLVEGLARVGIGSYLWTGVIIAFACLFLAAWVGKRTIPAAAERSEMIDPDMVIELDGLAFSLWLAACLAVAYGGVLDHLQDAGQLSDNEATSKRGFVGAFQLSYIFLVLGSAYVIVSDLFHSGTIYRRLRDRLFSGAYQRSMAHEIINPLGPVQRFLADPALSTLLNRPVEDNPSVERARASLLEGLPIMQDGVNQVMDFARRVRGGGSLETDDLVRIDLVPVLETIVNDYRATLPRKHPYRDITLSFESAVPTAIARVKLKLIPNVMRILLDNAAEATAPGRSNAIAVMIERSRNRLPGAESISVLIQDTGVGMSPQRVGQFGKQQRSSKPGGSGSGGAIAVDLMKAMKGEASILTSTPDSGTTIRLLFVAG